MCIIIIKNYLHKFNFYLGKNYFRQLNFLFTIFGLEPFVINFCQ